MPLFPDPVRSPLPRDTDWIYAHCDGGSRGNPGPSGYGAIIIDDAGDTLAELSEFLGIRTNNYAEYSGLLAVLEWAVENGHRRLKVVSDSELMVKQIQGKYRVNSPDLRPLWQKARDYLEKFDNFEISHALRDKNKAADALANRAMDQGHRRSGIRLAADIIPPRTAPKPDSKATRPKPIQPKPIQPKPIQPKLAEPKPIEPEITPRPIEPEAIEPKSRPAFPTMLRGVTRNGSIQILGGHKIADGIFVKIIRE